MKTISRLKQKRWIRVLVLLLVLILPPIPVIAGGWQPLARSPEGIFALLTILISYSMYIAFLGALANATGLSLRDWLEAQKPELNPHLSVVHPQSTPTPLPSLAPVRSVRQTLQKSPGDTEQAQIDLIKPIADAVERRYKFYYWERPFDPSDYMHPMAITQLYEAKIEAEFQLNAARKRIGQMEFEISNLRASKAFATSQLRGRSKRRWSTFALLLVATFSGGVGVNYITSDRNTVDGILFVAISIILQALVFSIRRTDDT